METITIVAMLLFIVNYSLMLIFPKYKTYISLGMGLIFITFGILPINKLFTSIDFNILLMILGTMGTVAIFSDSNMPSMLANILINKLKRKKYIIIALSLFSAFVSAFLDNVSTVIMLAPICLSIAKELKLNPITVLIPVAIFSNIEGAATLVGDTTSIMLASSTKMNFVDFFFFKGKIGLFFIVQLGTIGAALVLYKLLKIDNKKINIKADDVNVTSIMPTICLLLTISSLIIASLFPTKMEYTNGIICVGFFIIALIHNIISTKNKDNIKKYIKEIDYETLLLLTAIFILVAGISEAGVLEVISKGIINIFGSSEVMLYTSILFISVIISAFIDNIPYVAAMLPVISIITSQTGFDPTILYYGLIVGSTLGGNFTPIGASANITAIGMLKSEGHEVSSKEYFKYSIPLTITTTLIGYLAILLFIK